MGYFSKLNLLSLNCLRKFSIDFVVANSYPKKFFLLYQLIWIKTEYKLLKKQNHLRLSQSFFQKLIDQKFSKMGSILIDRDRITDSLSFAHLVQLNE